MTETGAPGIAPDLVTGPLTSVVRTVWCRLPADWVVNGRLSPARRSRLVDELLGADDRPRRGNLLILRVQATLLTPEQAALRPWSRDIAAFYRYDPDGTPHETTPDHL